MTSKRIEKWKKKKQRTEMLVCTCNALKILQYWSMWAPLGWVGGGGGGQRGRGDARVPAACLCLRAEERGQSVGVVSPSVGGSSVCQAAAEGATSRKV